MQFLNCVTLTLLVFHLIWSRRFASLIQFSFSWQICKTELKRRRSGVIELSGMLAYCLRFNKHFHTVSQLSCEKVNFVQFVLVWDRLKLTFHITKSIESIVESKELKFKNQNFTLLSTELLKGDTTYWNFVNWWDKFYLVLFISSELLSL